MGAATDFRVLQTHDEIRRLVYDAAISELADDDEGRDPLTDGEWRYVDAQARRIADNTVANLDAV